MKKRILIIDDSSSIRGLMRAFIESRPDLEVCGEAADGVEGVEKGKELRPDLIVLDLSMPRMNGLEAAAALRGIMPTTPIILFTFYRDVITGHDAREAGVTSVLSKTDQITSLVNEVQRLTA